MKKPRDCGPQASLHRNDGAAVDEPESTRRFWTIPPSAARAGRCLGALIFCRCETNLPAHRIPPYTGNLDHAQTQHFLLPRDPCGARFIATKAPVLGFSLVDERGKRRGLQFWPDQGRQGRAWFWHSRFAAHPGRVVRYLTTRILSPIPIYDRGTWLTAIDDRRARSVDAFSHPLPYRDVSSSGGPVGVGGLRAAEASSCSSILNAQIRERSGCGSGSTPDTNLVEDRRYQR